MLSMQDDEDESESLSEISTGGLATTGDLLAHLTGVSSGLPELLVTLWSWSLSPWPESQPLVRWDEEAWPGNKGIFIGIRVFPGKLATLVEHMDVLDDDELLVNVEEETSSTPEAVEDPVVFMNSEDPKVDVRLLDIFMNLPSGGP